MFLRMAPASVPVDAPKSRMQIADLLPGASSVGFQSLSQWLCHNGSPKYLTGGSYVLS